MDSRVSQDSLVDKAVDLDRRIAQRLRRATNDDWLDINLPLPSLRALLAIDRQPGVTPSEIAAYLGVSRSSASAILDRLEAESLLQRAINPMDRRQFFVSLTSGGQAIVERVDGQRRKRLREALQRVSAADLQALTTGIAALEIALAEMERTKATPTVEAIVQ